MLDLSPQQSSCLRAVGAAESVQKLPLTIKPSRDSVAHALASEDERSRHCRLFSLQRPGTSRQVITSPKPSAPGIGRFFFDFSHVRWIACYSRPGWVRLIATHGERVQRKALGGASLQDPEHRHGTVEGAAVPA